MNHSDIEQTMRYAKLAPDSGKKNVLNLYKSVFARKTDQFQF